MKSKATATSSFRCPACQGEAEKNQPCFPFCSERCRLVDLGGWASGRYVIADRPGSAALPDPEPND